MSTLAITAGLYLGTVWSFVAIMQAKRLADRLDLFWRVHLYPLACIGLVLDALFNLTFGTLIFQELPRELLFSARVQRHFGKVSRRGRMAAFWARQLNQIDAEHIK